MRGRWQRACVLLPVSAWLLQHQALGRQQLTHIGVAGGDVSDDELRTWGGIAFLRRITMQLLRSSFFWQDPAMTPSSAAIITHNMGPAQRLAWMPMRCSLLCRVTKERAAVASRPCTRLQRSRGQGKQAGMLRLRIRCPHRQ